MPVTYTFYTIYILLNLGPRIVGANDTSVGRPLVSTLGNGEHPPGPESEIFFGYLDATLALSASL